MSADILYSAAHFGMGATCGVFVSFCSSLFGAHIGTVAGGSIGSYCDARTSVSDKVHRVSERMFGMLGSIAGGYMCGGVGAALTTIMPSDYSYLVGMVCTSLPTIFLTTGAYTAHKYFPREMRQYKLFV